MLIAHTTLLLAQCSMHMKRYSSVTVLDFFSLKAQTTLARILALLGADILHGALGVLHGFAQRSLFWTGAQRATVICNDCGSMK